MNSNRADIIKQPQQFKKKLKTSEMLIDETSTKTNEYTERRIMTDYEVRRKEQIELKRSEKNASSKKDNTKRNVWKIFEILTL